MNVKNFLAGVVVKSRPESGHRQFKQDLDDPSVYWEITTSAERGTPYSAIEIDGLTAAGWQCITIEYALQWRE